MTFPRHTPRVEGRTVEGLVLHIDHFGNILTNISSGFLNAVQLGQDLRVSIGDITRTMPFCRTYADGEPHALVCLINSNEEFEVACPQGRAIEHMRAGVGDRVLVTWE